MPKVLFIGGANDGARVWVNDPLPADLSLPAGATEPLPPAHIGEAVPVSDFHKLDVYVLEKIQAPGIEIPIYLQIALSDSDLGEKLIEGYGGLGRKERAARAVKAGHRALMHLGVTAVLFDLGNASRKILDNVVEELRAALESLDGDSK